MSVPALGHNGYFQFVKETTYGTAPAAATDKVEVVNFKPILEVTTVRGRNMNTAGSSPREIGRGLKSTGFSFEMDMTYEGANEFLRMFFPTYSQSTVDTSARSHLFKEGVALSSYACEFSMGNIPSSKVTRWTGCYGTSLEFAIRDGRLVAMCEFAAEDIAENTAPMTAATVANFNLVLFHHLLLTASNLNDGTSLTPASIVLQDVGFSFKYPMNTKRVYLGSEWANSPVQSGPLEAKVTFTEEWDANTYPLMAIFRGATAPAALKFVFQHPTVIGAVSAKRELEFICSSPTPAGYEPEVPGFQEITQKATYELAYNTTDASCCKVRAQNLGAALP